MEEFRRGGGKKCMTSRVKLLFIIASRRSNDVKLCRHNVTISQRFFTKHQKNIYVIFVISAEYYLLWAVTQSDKSFLQSKKSRLSRQKTDPKKTRRHPKQLKKPSRTLRLSSIWSKVGNEWTSESKLCLTASTNLSERVHLLSHGNVSK